MVVGVSAIMVATPASATEKNDCTLGNVCLFKDNNFGGGIKLYGGNQASYSGEFLNCVWYPWISCAVDNGASSVYNHGSTHNVRLYANASYGGATLAVLRSASYDNLGGQGFNDVASSHKWY
jgi:hypothetical protein